jgi:hypothetical protein
LTGTSFHTIECNPAHYWAAHQNLVANALSPFVKLLYGLSVPRALLPTADEIFEQTVRNVDGDGIFVDHQQETRVEGYYRETNFPGGADDLLGRCLGNLDGKPDLVLLDSAGHMGNVEFNYLIQQLRGACFVVLDDIDHIKHFKSFRQIQRDPRFTVITTSHEKFGFCIAKFSPGSCAATAP